MDNENFPSWKKNITKKIMNISEATKSKEVLFSIKTDGKDSDEDDDFDDVAAFYDQVDKNHDHLLFKSLKSEV